MLYYYMGRCYIILTYFIIHIYFVYRANIMCIIFENIYYNLTVTIIIVLHILYIKWVTKKQVHVGILVKI
jgi:hypothetical protein